MRRFLALFVFLVLSVTALGCRRKQPAVDPTVNAAQSEDARVRHNEATRYYAERNYEAALQLYEQAYKAGHRHISLLGAANCLKALRRNTQAHDAYQHVLVVHASQVSKEEKKQANLAIRELNVASGTVTIEVLDPDAEVEIDGRPAGRSPMFGPRDMSAGQPHQVRVMKPGFPVFEQNFQVGVQEQKKIQANLGAGGGGGAQAFAQPTSAPTTNAPPIEMSDSERRAAARAAYIDGVELQDGGNCPAAIQRFETAQRMFDAPTHLLHLAECQAATGKLVEARENYNTLDRLKLAVDAPDAFKKAQVQARDELKKLSPRIPTLKIETNPPGTTLKNLSITANGSRFPNDLLGIARPVNPGTYKIVGRSDRMSATADAEIKEGDAKVLELRFAK